MNPGVVSNLIGQLIWPHRTPPFGGPSSKEDSAMTVTAQGLSPQALPSQAMGSQPGSFSPVFPNPIGVEQPLGFPQAHGFQPSIWPQPAFAWQTPYGMPTWAYGQQPW